MSAILHLLSRSANQGDSLQQCIRYVTAGDAVVLLEEAVVESLEGSQIIKRLKGQGVAAYVMQPELELRGLADANLCDGVDLIDYETLVSLVIDHELSQTWS